METTLPQELSDNHCRNCGTELIGKFCYSCGQKKIEPSERTFKYFVVQFLGSAFFLENNFLKNVWYVLAKPGRQAIDFIEGRQKRWMPPFSLFLLINLFYFWYTPLSDMNLTLHEQLGQAHHGAIATKMTKSRLEKRQVSLEEYEQQYNAKSSGYSNSLIILHVPLLALFVMLMFYRANYFFVDYFIVSLYFLAFLLLMGLGLGWFVNLVDWLVPSSGPVLGVIFPWMLTISLVTFTAIYLRNIFRESWAKISFKTVLFLAAFFIVHHVYRTVLFFIIFWAT